MKVYISEMLININKLIRCQRLIIYVHAMRRFR